MPDSLAEILASRVQYALQDRSRQSERYASVRRNTEQKSSSGGPGVKRLWRTPDSGIRLIGNGEAAG